MNQQLLANRLMIFFLGIFYLIGIILHSIPLFLPFLKVLTPWISAVSGLIVLWFSINSKDRYSVLLLAFSGVLCFLIEILGVHTGFPFGHYSYTTVLGRQIAGVPVSLLFHWSTVLLGSYSLATLLSHDKNKWIVSISAGLFAAAYDLILEQAALRWNYWHWENNAVPLVNYFSWFFIAFCTAMGYFILNLKTDKKLPAFYIILQMVFFAFLSIF